MRLIDADALKEEIESLKVYVSGIRSGRKITDELLKEYRESVIDRIEEQPTASKRIPCSERLPNTDIDVLILVKSMASSIPYALVARNASNNGEVWEISGQVFYETLDQSTIRVIAWMPLPGAYKECD